MSELGRCKQCHAMIFSLYSNPDMEGFCTYGCRASHAEFKVIDLEKEIEALKEQLNFKTMTFPKDKKPYKVGFVTRVNIGGDVDYLTPIPVDLYYNNEIKQLKEAFFDYLDKTPNELVNELIIGRGCLGEDCTYEFDCDNCPIIEKELMDENPNT